MAKEKEGEQPGEEQPPGEQPGGEEMVHYRHPDGHLQEMTRSEADALTEKEQKQSDKDWKKQIKTRSE